MEKRLQYEHLVLAGLRCKQRDGMFAHADYYDFANRHLKENYCFVLAALVGLMNNEGYSKFSTELANLVEEVGKTVYTNKETETGLDDILDRVQEIGIIL